MNQENIAFCVKREQICETFDIKHEDIDEMDAVSWNRQNNPTQGPAGERDPKKVGQSTSAYGLNK